MQARRYVEAPAAKPLPYGLLSAALVINDTDPHLGLGVQYETLMCGGTHSTQDACIANIEQASPWLTADDGKDLVVADAFHIYALHTCRTVGSFSTAEADARTRLEVGGSRGIEEGFGTSLAAADDLTPTPGTPVHPIAGLAILEEYAANHYGGVPVVHITRGSGTMLGHLGGMKAVGNHLETVQGAVIASGGGYDATVTIDGITPDAGGRWMRVTGAVVVRRGPVQSYGASLRRATTSGTGRVVGQRLNDFSAFAQQPVTVSYECINAAVLVQAPALFYSSDGGAP